MDLKGMCGYSYYHKEVIEREYALHYAKLTAVINYNGILQL